METRQNSIASCWTALKSATRQTLITSIRRVLLTIPLPIASSGNFEYPVALQVDFGRTFMLYRSVVTFYHALPAAMYLLKSNDSGRTFSPIRYFATNCTVFFNMPETPENETEGLKVQCFKIDPDTNPNLQVSWLIEIFICKKWNDADTESIEIYWNFHTFCVYKTKIRKRFVKAAMLQSNK